MKPAPDLTGQTFGRLTVLRRATNKGLRGATLWVCVCECWREREVEGTSLKRGTVKSCGCLKAEARPEAVAGSTTHGHRLGGKRTREYNSWDSMIQRCTNPTRGNYPRYGGRGVKVAKRWWKFSKFLEDMGPRPAGTTLERKNNAGNYTPGNCKWATPKEQANNRRNNVVR